jgi:hypothetical protein
MQKRQISIFISDPLSGSPLGEALAPQGDLKQKKGHKINCSQNSFLEGVYFMQKCQISIFISDPPSGSPFWEALVP